VVHTLSKARKDQVEGGRVPRYLKYALGETVLIVVGILIALQINDWYQARLDRQQEHAFLTSLHQDLQEDVADLTFAIEGNAQLIAGVANLLDLLAQPGDDEAYQRNLYLHTLKYGYWFMTMEFSDVTMAQLKYGGGLRLIADQQIRLAMLGYEKGIETLQVQYEQLSTYFHTFEASQKALFNPMLSRQAFDYIEEDFFNMLQPLATFDTMVPEGEYLIIDDPRLWTRYYGDMLYYKTALSNTNLLLIQQRVLAESLIAQIMVKYHIDSRDSVSNSR